MAHRARSIPLIPVTPVCPVCEKEVLPRAHVVFGHGEFIHMNCHLMRDGLVVSVADLLRSKAGEEFCHTCLARLLHSTYEQVVKAVTALRMSSHYRAIALSKCSVCGNNRTTIHTRLSSGG